MLLRSPVGPIGVQKQEHPNQISFVECPASWLFAAGGGGKVRSRPRVLQRVHRSAAESLDGFFPSLPDRCLKRGHLTKEENWSPSLLLYARTHVGAGRCGAGHWSARGIAQNAPFLTAARLERRAGALTKTVGCYYFRLGETIVIGLNHPLTMARAAHIAVAIIIRMMPVVCSFAVALDTVFGSSMCYMIYYWELICR